MTIALERPQVSWREVEIPPRIAALPRSTGGLPVPYVAAWEGEGEMRIAPCRWVFGRQAIFPANGSMIGKTRPEFGVMEPSRQREVVQLVCCQVCRIQLRPMSAILGADREPLWLIDLLHEPETMRGHRLALEPWVCDECLVYALQVCPGMLLYREPAIVRKTIKVPRAHRLKNILAVWTANAIATTVAPGGNLRGQLPCISYCKIEPLRYRRISAAHVLEYGPAEIRSMMMQDGPPS